jgi:hypothetical protein
VFVPGAPIWIDAVPIWDGDERGPDGTTIQNTILYFGPDGQMIDKHGKLMLGHYHRSDVLQLTVDTRPRHAVMLVSEDAASDN